MPYLKNPAGRIVCIDDPKEFQVYANKEGFTPLSKEEENEYITQRYELATVVGNPHEEPKIEEYVKGVYLSTVVDGGKDGYGIASEKLVQELVKAEVNISRSFNNQKIGLLFHNPYSVLKMENPVRVIYTMFESTKIPDDWNTYLHSADKVIVPSKWCQKVFKDSGVEADVIPLGYDEEVFKYYKRENKRESHKPFVFLHYNAFNIRKGFLEVFKAFTEEFQNGEPVKLVLKTTLEQPPIPFTKEKYPNIEIICEKYPEKELIRLINKSDCFVFLSRGEGFGMTPLECMATGMPVIVPNAHGISEYFNKNCMYEVKVKEECPALYHKYKGEDVGKMVICDVKDLRKQMRYVYEHQDEALKMGKKASNYAKKWTFKKTASQFKKLIDELYIKEISNKKNLNVLQLVEVK